MAGKDAYGEFEGALAKLREAAMDAYYAADTQVAEEIAMGVWGDIEQFYDMVGDWDLAVMGWG